MIILKNMVAVAQGLFLLLPMVGTINAFASENCTTSSVALVPCGELPQGDLTDAELEKLAPTGSCGRVRVAWGTESQEETYGFNILRSDSTEGPYVAINASIIPGEGTSNAPHKYCFEDAGVERGRVYYYQIEEVTNAGTKNIIEGTAGTKVAVKTVQEERAWLKKKAAQSVAQ
jgi:hypothetical protein